MGQKQYDQVIALVYAALRNGQPQPWMYESLGIAMELAGRSKPEIERAVMSAADFSTAPDELMYIAQYLSRLSLNRRAMQLYQQVAKLEPLRGDAYALGLRAAQQCDDLAGIQWATVGILSQAWPNDQAEIQLTASRVAKATLARLESEGKTAERDAYLKQLQDAVIWDCVVQVSWTGNGGRRSLRRRAVGNGLLVGRAAHSGGGVALGDSYAAGGRRLGEVFSETYVCPRGFAGTYKARIHRVLGDVTAGKVTVDVYTHLRSGEVQHERQQLALDDKDAMVVFNLDKGQPHRAPRSHAAGRRRQAAASHQPLRVGSAAFEWLGPKACCPSARSTISRGEPCLAAARSVTSRSFRQLMDGTHDECYGRGFGRPPICPDHVGPDLFQHRRRADVHLRRPGRGGGRSWRRG